jgi:hypothetical protein
MNSCLTFLSWLVVNGMCATTEPINLL